MRLLYTATQRINRRPFSVSRRPCSVKYRGYVNVSMNDRYYCVNTQLPAFDQAQLNFWNNDHYS